MDPPLIYEKKPGITPYHQGKAVSRLTPDNRDLYKKTIFIATISIPRQPWTPSAARSELGYKSTQIQNDTINYACHTVSGSQGVLKKRVRYARTPTPTETLLFNILAASASAKIDHITQFRNSIRLADQKI